MYKDGLRRCSRRAIRGAYARLCYCITTAPQLIITASRFPSVPHNEDTLFPDAQSKYGNPKIKRAKGHYQGNLLTTCSGFGAEALLVASGAGLQVLGTGFRI